MSAQSTVFNPSQTTSAATGDGFSVPRLGTATRLAINFTALDKGMMVYDVNLNNLFIWNGSAWESVPASGDAGANGSVQYNDNGIVSGAANLQYDKAGGFTSLRSGSALRAYVADNSVYSTISDLGAAGGLTINNLNADGISLKVGSVNTNVLGAGTANWYDGAGVSQMAFVGSNKSLTLGADLRIWRGGGSGADNVGIGRLSGDLLTTGVGNVGLGLAAGRAISTGDKNVAIGADCLGNQANLITGSNNIAIGNTALYSSNVISGADNIGIGQNTLRALSTGFGNIACGLNSGIAITSGTVNVTIGQNALISNQTGSSNVAVGPAALNACVVGDQTAVGTNALFLLQSGGANTAVGRDSLRNLVSNSNCTALGYFAGRATTGQRNTAIGANALALSTSGDANTAVGYNAMGLAVVTSGDNTCIGDNAGANIAGGGTNTCIGSAAGSNIVGGGSNICIGVNAATSAAGNSNELSIGSSVQYVATNGAAATYFATATAGAVIAGNPQGFIRIRLNGTFVKIPVYGN
jgi:hypothetical protein